MKNFLQQIENTLNAASEIFLLIAVVGLLALPFAVAGNLNPIASQESASQNVAVKPSKSVLGVTNKEDRIPITSDASISLNKVNTAFADVVLEKNQPNNYSVGFTAKKDLAENVYHIENKGSASVVINPSLNIGAANPENVILKINAKSYIYKEVKPITMLPGEQIEIGIQISKQVYPVKVELGLSL